MQIAIINVTIEAKGRDKVAIQRSQAMPSKIDINKDFYDPVKRIADTFNQDISADVVSRVLACASHYLHSLSACQALAVLSTWLLEEHDRVKQLDKDNHT